MVYFLTIRCHPFDEKNSLKFKDDISIMIFNGDTYIKDYILTIAEYRNHGRMDNSFSNLDDDGEDGGGLIIS